MEEMNRIKLYWPFYKTKGVTIPKHCKLDVTRVVSPDMLELHYE